MATSILIVGESGSGKTTSLRNLPPQHTYYIDADRKRDAWFGFKKCYNKENNNYICTDDPAKIYGFIKNISEKGNGVKYIVVDTLNGVMVGEEMRRSKEKNFDKWVDIASYIYNIIDLPADLRDDLIIIFTAHSQTERDESGYIFTRMKTTGKKLDKIVPESKFNIVLLSKVKDGKHIFETRANNSTAKVPFGIDIAQEIDNDITIILEKIQQ